MKKYPTKIILHENKNTCSAHKLKSYCECILELIARLIEMVCCGEKKMECVINGYHVYKAIWAAAITEDLV